MRIFPSTISIEKDEGFKKRDIFKRQYFGESLSRLVKDSNEALVIGLDAPWGEGKTTFVKQWIGLLRQEEYAVDAIYFDAFANDYLDRPLEALADKFYEFVDRKAKKDDSDSFWKDKKKTFLDGAKEWVGSKAPSIGKVLGATMGTGFASCSGGGVETEMIAAGVASAGEQVGINVEEYFKNRLNRKYGLKEFRNALEEMGKLFLDVKGSPLVFVVDELDRCRPDFALDLIESIKHVFSVPGIVFLLVYNSEQMYGHIRCRYGVGINAETYMNKFISIGVLLPKSINHKACSQDDNYRYINYLCDELGLNLNDLDAYSAIVGKIGLALREIEKVLSLIVIIKLSVQRELSGWDQVIFGLSLIRVVDVHLFYRIKNGEQCWDDVCQFFKLNELSDSEREKFDINFFEQSWRSLLDPDAPDELKKRFASPYYISNQLEEYCRAMTIFNLKKE